MNGDNLSDPTAAMSLAREGVDANSAAIDSVLNSLIQYCQGTISANDAALKKAKGKITRTVNGVINYQNRGLTQVVNNIADSISSSVAENEIGLNKVLVAATVGQQGNGEANTLRRMEGPGRSAHTAAGWRIWVNCNGPQTYVLPASDDYAALLRAGYILATTELFPTQNAAYQWIKSIDLPSLYRQLCPPGRKPAIVPPSMGPLPSSVAADSFGRIPPALPGVPPGPGQSPAMPPQPPMSGQPPVSSNIVSCWGCCDAREGKRPWFIINSGPLLAGEERRLLEECVGKVEKVDLPYITEADWVNWVHLHGVKWLQDRGCPI